MTFAPMAPQGAFSGAPMTPETQTPAALDTFATKLFEPLLAAQREYFNQFSRRALLNSGLVEVHELVIGGSSGSFEDGVENLKQLLDRVSTPGFSRRLEIRLTVSSPDLLYRTVGDGESRTSLGSLLGKIEESALSSIYTAFPVISAAAPRSEALGLSAVAPYVTNRDPGLVSFAVEVKNPDRWQLDPCDWRRQLQQLVRTLPRDRDSAPLKVFLPPCHTVPEQDMVNLRRAVRSIQARHPAVRFMLDSFSAEELRNYPASDYRNHFVVQSANGDPAVLDLRRTTAIEEICAQLRLFRSKLLQSPRSDTAKAVVMPAFTGSLTPADRAVLAREIRAVRSTDRTIRVIGDPGLREDSHPTLASRAASLAARVAKAAGGWFARH